MYLQCYSVVCIFNALCIYSVLLWGTSVLKTFDLFNSLAERHLSTFYGTIDVGGQQFKMLMDTGSCELWITSKHCDEYSEANICDSHTMFDETKSVTYKEFEGDKIMSVTVSRTQI